jgi:hypothetical protein
MKRPERSSCIWLLLSLTAPLASCGYDSDGLATKTPGAPTAVKPTQTPPAGGEPTPAPPPAQPPVSSTPPATVTPPATTPPPSTKPPEPATPPPSTMPTPPATTTPPPATMPPATMPPATMPPPSTTPPTPVPPASDPPPPPTATPVFDCTLKQPITFNDSRNTESADLAFDAEGYMVFANGRDVERMAKGGSPMMVLEGAISVSRVVDGLGILPGGDVLVADEQTDSLFRLTPGSNQRRAFSVQSPAKFARSPSGALWVTSTDGEVYRVDVETGKSTIVARTNGRLRGLTFSPDYKIIYLSDERAEELLSAQVHDDGTISEPRTFSGRLGQFPDGLATDICGNVYVADRFGGPLLRVTPTGKTEMVSAVNRAPLWGIAFGSGKQGWDDSTLYAVSSDRDLLYEIKVGVKGLPRLAP